MSNESREEQENLKSVTIHSPFQQAICQFDNEDFFPDVDIAVPGLAKILHLHRSHLASSQTLLSSFKGQKNEHCRYNGDKRALEWIHKEAENDDGYRRVFVKWLRFCYGEDQTFSVDECPVALTVVSELKLSCEEEVKKEIERKERVVVMKRREYMLKKIPGLMNMEEVKWSFSFSKEELETMSVLLKENAITTKSFDISREKTHIRRLL